MKKVALSMVRELALSSKSQIKEASKLANKCKVSGYIGGVLGCTGAALNVLTSIYSKFDDKKWCHLALAASTAAISVSAFKSVGTANKIQKMIKIASKYSAMA